MKNKNYMDAKLSRTNKNNGLRRRAFTLIELIVVMAVIAILVLLAMPRFASYVQKARAAQIVNDIKVVETKIDEYLFHHEDFPIEFTSATTGIGQMYDRTGPIETYPGDLMIVDRDFFKETNLKGEFYVDNDGNGYYQDEPGSGSSGEPAVVVIPPGASELVPLGNGTEADPYELWYLEHLAYIGTDATTMGAQFVLMRDLDFNLDEDYIDINNKNIWTQGEGWVTLGWPSSTAFSGKLRGQDNGISNLYINRPEDYYQGLFTYGDAATISDFSLKDINLNLSAYGAALFGDAASLITLDNVHVSGVILAKDKTMAGVVVGADNIGAFIGESYDSLKISDSSADISITGGHFIGGFVGFGNEVDILNSSAKSSISSDGNYVGGIIGLAKNVQISNSTASGNILITDINSGFSGGIIGGVGEYDSMAMGIRETGTMTMTDSHSLVDITGFSYIGGIAGAAYGVIDIDNSYANGQLKGTNYMGGLLGASSENWGINNISIDSSFSESEIQGNKFIGGIIGYVDIGIISNSYFSGQIIAGANNEEVEFIGGIYGQGFKSTIEDSYSASIISISSSNSIVEHIGGVAGEVRNSVSKIIRSYSTSNVSAPNGWYVGGLVGTMGGNISESYASGTVIGRRHVGGLAGYVSSMAALSISDSYSIATVEAKDDVAGSFVGTHNEGLIKNAFAAGNAVGIPSSAGFTGNLRGDYAAYAPKNENAYGITNPLYATVKYPGESTLPGFIEQSALQNGSLPAGFSSDIWTVSPGSYPILKWQ